VQEWHPRQHTAAHGWLSSGTHPSQLRSKFWTSTFWVGWMSPRGAIHYCLLIGPFHVSYTSICPCAYKSQLLPENKCKDKNTQQKKTSNQFNLFWIWKYKSLYECFTVLIETVLGVNACQDAMIGRKTRRELQWCHTYNNWLLFAHCVSHNFNPQAKFTLNYF